MHYFLPELRRKQKVTYKEAKLENGILSKRNILERYSSSTWCTHAF